VNYGNHGQGSDVNRGYGAEQNGPLSERMNLQFPNLITYDRSGFVDKLVNAGKDTTIDLKELSRLDWPWIAEHYTDSLPTPETAVQDFCENVTKIITNAYTDYTQDSNSQNDPQRTLFTKWTSTLKRIKGVANTAYNQNYGGKK
jgi:hypothetical protein